MNIKSKEVKIAGGALAGIGAIATALGAWFMTGETPSLQVWIGVGSTIVTAIGYVYEVIKKGSE